MILVFSSWNVSAAGSHPYDSSSAHFDSKVALPSTPGMASVLLTVTPANPCSGSSPVSFNSQAYSSGQTAQVSPSSSFPVPLIVPAPGSSCLGYEVSNVSVSPASNISLTSGSLLPSPDYTANVYVTGNGTIAIHYGIPVQMGFSPSSCPYPSFNGTPQANNSQFLTLPGTYSIVSICPGFAFQGWTTKGNLVVGNPTSPSTTVQVSPGGGDLWGNYTSSSSGGPPPSTLAHYQVTFQVSPGLCGPLVFNGTTFTSGTQITGVTAGTYVAAAPACSGYTFSSWTAIGPLVIQAPASANTNVSVKGNGTLELTYVTSGSPPPSQNSPPGGSSFLTSAVFLGIIAVLAVIVIALVFFLYLRSRNRRSADAAPALTPRPLAPSPPPPKVVSPASSPVPTAPAVAREPPWPMVPMTIVESQKAERMWAMVARSGFPRDHILVVSTEAPAHLSSVYGLAGAHFLRIARTEGEGNIFPADIDRLGNLMELHLQGGSARAVVFQGIDVVTDSTSPKTVRRLIQVLREVAETSRGAVLVYLNWSLLPPEQLKALEEGAVVLRVT